MKAPSHIVLGAFALSLSCPAAAALLPAEQQMIQTVDAEQQRTVSMLERWVNQNSGSMNLTGVPGARIQDRVDRHEAGRASGPFGRSPHGKSPRQAPAVDCSHRYGVRA